MEGLRVGDTGIDGQFDAVSGQVLEGGLQSQQERQVVRGKLLPVRIRLRLGCPAGGGGRHVELAHEIGNDDIHGVLGVVAGEVGDGMAAVGGRPGGAWRSVATSRWKTPGSKTYQRRELYKNGRSWWCRVEGW